MAQIAHVTVEDPGQKTPSDAPGHVKGIGFSRCIVLSQAICGWYQMEVKNLNIGSILEAQWHSFVGDSHAAQQIPISFAPHSVQSTSVRVHVRRHDCWLANSNRNLRSTGNLGWCSAAELAILVQVSLAETATASAVAFFNAVHSREFL
eukprot:s656_g4.t1